MNEEPRTEQVEAALRALLAEASEWPRPAARAVLVNPAGHVMRGTPHTTRWEYPGGGLDEGETNLDAALRETREEACCVGAEVPGLAPLGPLRGRAYPDRLGFGSPRHDGHGPAISRGAADLLHAAAVRLGLNAAAYVRHRDAWFDGLAGRVEVTWRHAVTYHVLALKKELPFRPSPWGWRERRWADFSEVVRLGEADPQGHTAWLLARGLEQAVAQATQLGIQFAGAYDRSNGPGV